MKSKIKVVFISMTVLAVMLIAQSFSILQEKPKPWDVPTKYEKMVNPTKESPDLKIGKMLYNKHCKSCHGSKGLGDGPKAKKLDTFPGDFSSKEFHAQSDGALFYKSLIGRDEMPNYEKDIPEADDMWNIVNYMRTFSK
jgi:mono/diheme cytochrome c family protein